MGASSMSEEISLEDIKEVDASTFFAALKNAKTKNRHGAYVTLRSTQDYENCKGTFLLYDKSAGIAVEQDGNIISVFSDRTHRGVLKYLIAKAVEAGGLKLDCFGSDKLRNLYALRGFIPIARTKFVKEFAPEDWDYEQDGKPNIIFWIYDICKKDVMANSENEYDWDNIKEFPTYEEAKKYRDSKILK